MSGNSSHQPESSALEFRSLLERARKAGAIEITFRVTLENYQEDTTQKHWMARAVLDPSIPNLAHGRTCEEVLRELVIWLERM